MAPGRGLSLVLGSRPSVASGRGRQEESVHREQSLGKCAVGRAPVPATPLPATLGARGAGRAVGLLALQALNLAALVLDLSLEQKRQPTPL